MSIFFVIMHIHHDTLDRHPYSNYVHIYFIYCQVIFKYIILVFIFIFLKGIYTVIMSIFILVNFNGIRKVIKHMFILINCRDSGVARSGVTLCGT